MTKLKKMMLRRGMKQVEVARKMQISRQCVCIAEKKGIRNAAAAERYAAALSCAAIDLIEV
ncbi:MAG: hypothetical protein J6Y54_06050 [Lentisphaeria bacterium]|nr:hypothetical protein [Lentisphaeria bacterium]